MSGKIPAGFHAKHKDSTNWSSFVFRLAFFHPHTAKATSLWECDKSIKIPDRVNSWLCDHPPPLNLGHLLTERALKDLWKLPEACGCGRAMWLMGKDVERIGVGCCRNVLTKGGLMRGLEKYVLRFRQLLELNLYETIWINLYCLCSRSEG